MAPSVRYRRGFLFGRFEMNKPVRKFAKEQKIEVIGDHWASGAKGYVQGYSGGNRYLCAVIKKGSDHVLGISCAESELRAI